ncbi:MAG: HK97 gp10 family phage protein [Cutibacterium avidum]|nr:HK97 gp10 family phage protein [Cutibacterium avidum]MDU5418790.1 HK97 gp10 family phage protein [Cutibacterium avidum]
MAFTVDTSQLNRLATDLGKTGYKATKKASQAVRKTALDVERIGKRRCPVDTGATRESIHTTASAGDMAAEIGPTTTYAPFLEWGTRHMEARPFMRPALDDVTPGFVRAMEQIGGGLFG